MRGVGALWRRLRRRAWRTAQDDRDLDDEIAFHLAQEATLRADRGADRAEAQAMARRAFGNVRQVKETTRGMTSWTTLETFAQDIRYGLRRLRGSPAFTFFCVASLALGIGATSAIFSLFDAIVLRPLPVRDPGRLVALSFSAGGSRPNNYLTYPLFDRLRSANTTLDGIFAWMNRPRMNLRIDGRVEIVAAAYVSGEYHPTLGLPPTLGCCHRMTISPAVRRRS
jgi:hypothetical protein